ncbi:quaternary ammonium compound-resistance protein SugE [Geomicrobium sp. JCM 19055]|nr:quaternary ammonium compound-resistance protein SugE [Geomicrobium sp. JCM 19055]
MWITVVIAALFEIGWATGLKYANDLMTWTLTIIAIIISFGLLIRAASSLPTSTVYAVFVGLGTVGTVAVDIVFFWNVSKYWGRFLRRHASEWSVRSKNGNR